MSKGFLQVTIQSLQSDYFQNNISIQCKADDSSNTLQYKSQEIFKINNYFPLAENLQIKVYDKNQPKIGYFKLPLLKLYGYPHTKHHIKVNLAGLDNNEISQDKVGVMNICVVFMKDITAKMNVYIQTVQFETQQQYKDLFVECKVGNVASPTTLKLKDQKLQWLETLPFILQNIPGTISFSINQKQNILGKCTISPHQIFLIQNQNQKRCQQIMSNNKYIGKLSLSILFNIIKN